MSFLQDTISLCMWRGRRTPHCSYTGMGAGRNDIWLWLVKYIGGALDTATTTAASGLDTDGTGCDLLWQTLCSGGTSSRTKRC